MFKSIIFCSIIESSDLFSPSVSIKAYFISSSAAFVAPRDFLPPEVLSLTVSSKAYVFLLTVSSNANEPLSIAVEVFLTSYGSSETLKKFS